MCNIYEQIESIREINRSHKLVIFVGAGVSKNSGVCSWWELVKDIADKIDYKDICEKCELKLQPTTEGDESCSSCCLGDSFRECPYRFNYSDTEFLKIPQYFYESQGEEAYIQFLQSIFNKSYNSNEIDELIVELEPEHIITTNYDHLIESVLTPSVSDYTVIIQDKDLLEKYGRKYIIKMHGDIDDIGNVTLKEDDYLNYSKSHELIEMFIKSLLIDKTFLFVGYSLNDNNLKLIMSYINYMANVLKIKRAPHYLAVSKIDHPQRDIAYWKSKGVELVDLSTVTQYMREKTPCKLAADPGKKLYTFLYYIRNEKLPFYEDAYKQLMSSMHNEAMALKPFLRVSNSTILEICSFKHGAELVSDILKVVDQSEYDSLCSVLDRDDTIKACFIKSGITSVANFHSTSRYNLITSEMPTDTLFDLSLNWNYSEIIRFISSSKNPFEQAYYYFLIYKTTNELCRDSLARIDEIINKKDYLHLTLEDKYHIAILEFNKIALRLLYRERNNDTQWEKLNRLLDSASTQSKAFDYIRKLSKDNGDMIHKLNTLLLEHEEFYMRKSTTLKMGGTGFGKILQIQAVVYDYYYFYKKNYIMLDWFNNVSKICHPYIKAILCTYYPDEYQISSFPMGRTYTETYTLNIIDINLIIRHISYKEFCSWLSYYKVFNLNIQEDIDIAELFDHFCNSIRSEWQTEYSEYINLFCKILSLIEITPNDCHRILSSFLKLVTPDDQITIKMAQICIKALWLFVSKHHDYSDETYLQLLSIYINSSILDDLLNMENDYIHIIKILSVHADREICDKCSGVIDHYIYDKQKRAHCLYIFKDILRKNDDNKFKELIIGNIDSASPYEVFDYLSNGIIEFDDTIADYFASRLSEIKHTPGLISYPDHKTELVEIIVCLFISGIIPDLSYFSVLKSYCDEYSYLGFLFDPQSFDYSQIQLSDTMWYNIISTEKYREIILQHKAEFWSKEQEQRISLGFGSEFENRIAYKYLFD